MKNILLLLIVCLLSFQLKSQNQESRDLDQFTSVSSSQSIKVTLKKGNNPRVDVSTTGELEDVVTDVKGGKLIIEMASNKMYRNVEVELIVYFQQLESLKASSSSRMVAEDIIETESLEVKGSSSARIDLKVKASNIEIDGSSSARISIEGEADNIESEVSSSCRLSLSGKAENFEAAVSSSGKIDAENFTCQNANLTASSSGRIDLNVESELIAKASSSGKISYGGKPAVVDANTGSGGKVSRM